jgi:hypothetical protein
LATTWLLYEGPRLIVVARKGGREIEWRAAPRAAHLALFQELLHREFRNPSRIVIEEMDGGPASAHEYAALLTSFGFQTERTTLILEKSYE